MIQWRRAAQVRHMNMKLRVTKFIWPFIWPFILFSALGCVNVEEFTSPVPIADGIRGKEWRSPEYLETNPLNPAITGDRRTFQSFAVTSSGTKVVMAASLYDTAAARFHGYARQYVEGTGWSVSGPGFSVVVTEAGQNMTYASIASSPGGFWLAAFQDDIGVAAQNTLTALNNGSWQAMQSSATGGAAYAVVNDQTYGSPIRTEFDGIGRAYVLVVNEDTSAFRLKRWSQTSGIDLTLDPLWAGTTAPGDPTLLLDQKYDGERWLCVFGQDYGGAADLHKQCYDTTGVVAWNTASTPASDEIISVSPRHGFALASSHDGRILVAAHEDIFAENHVVARFIEDGVVSGLDTVVSFGMPYGTTAFDTAGNAPQAVYLGDGYFMIAWIASDGLYASIYYSVYNPVTGMWSEAARATDNIAVTSISPFRSLHLFSNEDLNAGFAAGFDVVETGVRTLATARFQLQHGWLPTNYVGTGCDTGAIGGMAACTHRPQGAITARGDTVVVYADQDASGNFRLTGVQFR